jgi:hypothetical protein
VQCRRNMLKLRHVSTRLDIHMYPPPASPGALRRRRGMRPPGPLGRAGACAGVGVRHPPPALFFMKRHADRRRGPAVRVPRRMLQRSMAWSTPVPCLLMAGSLPRSQEADGDRNKQACAKQACAKQACAKEAPAAARLSYLRKPASSAPRQVRAGAASDSAVCVGTASGTEDVSTASGRQYSASRASGTRQALAQPR